jgi:polyhydroxyalkanoate synthase
MNDVTTELATGAVEVPVALNPMLGVDLREMIDAVGSVLKHTAGRPGALARQLRRFGGELGRIATGRSPLEPDKKDRRFQDPAWAAKPLYRAALQSWLAAQRGIDGWITSLDLDEIDRVRARFVLGTLLLDAIAPTNTLLGNPPALKRAVETRGRSLVRGLEHAIHDARHNHWMPSQVDKRPFEVGRNLATTKGAVVYRTDVLELLQYDPLTPEVFGTPLLIIPPQINKFYVNDLTPEKSLVRYLVQGGFQVFMVSWRNPQAADARWDLGRYVTELVRASDAVLAITGSERLHVSGACSGAITSATFASRLAADRDDRLRSLTLQVCVLDPHRDDTEIGALVSKSSIELARRRSQRKGVLAGHELARTFAWMRPNDLVWSYVVNNYYMGDEPPPFDVLYWNNDSTNLPADLHSDYLRLYEAQPFAQPGTEWLAGHPVDLRKVTADAFVLAGMTDHITPWKACYRTTGLLGSRSIEFVLATAGHIQAILSPPGSTKAKHLRATSLPATADEWRKGAQETPGSWWPTWLAWLAARSSARVAAPANAGNAKYPPLGPAPGTYVHG